MKKLRRELLVNVDEKTRASTIRFFKEPVKVYGVKSVLVSRIAKKYWDEVRDFNKQEIFDICEEMLASDYCEEFFIAAAWLPKIVKQFEWKDLDLFEIWIEKYVNNWAKCDTFCNHTLGDFIDKYPKTVQVLKKWTHSKNRWMKRAAAVSLILPARRGEYLSDVFEIADILLLDQDDMVQKGYGWMLKEASRLHQKEVFDYVVKNKKVMPRTSLRYAIEKMPSDLRAQAMQRD